MSRAKLPNLEVVLAWSSNRLAWTSTSEYHQKEAARDKYTLLMVVLVSCFTLAKHSHQIHDVVDIAPVKNAAVDNGPAAFVVGADHFSEVAVKVDPEPAQVG